MKVSLIVAMERNGVIGRDGGLPWHLSADLKRFKQLTMGHHIIMGRKTFESIGRLLPGRTSVIVTRQQEYVASGAVIAHSLSDALAAAEGDDEVFIIGGAEIYRQAINSIDRIYLTDVAANVSGDARFPEFDRSDWSIVEQSAHPADDRNDHPHTFTVLERIR
ncbi:MAG: dihydrofolate reductase [Planctomycetaceae bacterium]|nr:dihydrofolate reductase [Planctomycetales bacterium]MCB9923493.1 dihydrofolate reductase [Planctomycetaceae bacterium]